MTADSYARSAVLDDELQLVPVDNRKIERILARTRHFEHLRFTEVDDYRTLGTGRPMSDWLGQLDDVDSAISYLTAMDLGGVLLDEFEILFSYLEHVEFVAMAIGDLDQLRYVVVTNNGPLSASRPPLKRPLQPDDVVFGDLHHGGCHLAVLSILSGTHR